MSDKSEEMLFTYDEAMELSRVRATDALNHYMFLGEGSLELVVNAFACMGVDYDVIARAMGFDTSEIDNVRRSIADAIKQEIANDAGVECFDELVAVSKSKH